MTAEKDNNDSLPVARDPGYWNVVKIKSLQLAVEDPGTPTPVREQCEKLLEELRSGISQPVSLSLSSGSVY